MKEKLFSNELDIVKILEKKHTPDKVTLELDRIVFAKIDQSNISREIKFSNTYIMHGLAVAAIFVIIILTGLFIYNQNPTLNIKTKLNHITVSENTNYSGELKAGDIITTKSNVTFKAKILKDTVIKVNSDSSLKVNKLKSKSLTNDIELFITKGEALFNVEKLKRSESFLVETNLVYIKVIGTVFKVSNNDNKTSKITVYEGVVSVLNKSDKKETFVSEGEQFTINNSSKISKISQDNNKEFETFLTELNTHNNNRETFKKSNLKYVELFHASSKTPIIGFTSNKEYIVCNTSNEIICFDKNRNYLWNKKFSERPNHYFNSKSSLIGDNIYITTIANTLLIIDPITGNIIENQTLEDNISFGYSIQEFNDVLYYPFMSGIYKSSPQKKDLTIFSNKTGSSEPLIYQNKLFGVSYVTKELFAYNLHGKELFTTPLYNRSFSVPIIFNDTVLSIDTKGIIYQYTLEGIKIKTIQLPAGVVASPAIYKNNLYVIANNGKLYSVNILNNTIKSLYTLYSNTDKNNFLYIKPVIYNGKLYAGTNKGELYIYDTINNSSKMIKLSNDMISSTPLIYNGLIFLGDNNGKIYYTLDTISGE